MIRFEEGSLLRGADLNDQVRAESRLAELHVEGVHDTWGVATGLRVQLSADRRWALVTAGHAFDRRGRVVTLGAAATIAAPAVPVPGVAQPAFDLLLDRNGVRWERADGAAEADIPLGRCVRLGDGSLLAMDRSVRRGVRALTRPHVGFGITPPGGLTWTAGTAGLRAIVDTTEAGFTATPFYLAHVAALPALPAGYLPPFLSLAWFYPGRFSARLTFLSTMGRSASLAVAEMLQLAPSIRLAWIGVETLVGCSAGAPGGAV